MMYTVCNRHPLVEMCMLFVGTSIIHHSTEGIFILCNIWDLLIYSSELSVSKGVVVCSEHIELNFEEIKAMADKLMYADKDEYYRRTGKDRRRV